MDVEAEGVSIGIDIHQDASEVANLSKLEAEGPIFGLMPAKSADRPIGQQLPAAKRAGRKDA